MRHRIRADTGTGSVSVDGRDVAAWVGSPRPPDSDDPVWRQRASDYVLAHPRAAGSAGVAASQRLAVLRRLAAGPASRAELLAALRTCGWVGADDVENRLRDLRAADRRAGAAQTGLPLAGSDGRYWLEEPLPTLSEADRRALGFAKTMMGRLDGPLAAQAGAALDGLLPGLPGGPGERSPVRWRAQAADYQRFDAARVDRRGVEVHYFSLNSGYARTYLVVPVEYVTIGPVVKAVCVPVDAEGRRARGDLQFAMDRLLGTRRLPDQPPTPEDDLHLQRSTLVLEMPDTVYQVLRERNVFGLALVDGNHSDYEDTWRVRGTFPTALAWDVMEQLCAWAGNVQIHEPLWLVNAVCRRLRAGLRVMEEGATFEIVKPEVDRRFDSHGAAVTSDAPLPASTHPRKLARPAQRRRAGREGR